MTTVQQGIATITFQWCCGWNGGVKCIFPMCSTSQQTEHWVLQRHIMPFKWQHGYNNRNVDNNEQKDFLSLPNYPNYSTMQYSHLLMWFDVMICSACGCQFDLDTQKCTYGTVWNFETETSSLLLFLSSCCGPSVLVTFIRNDKSVFFHHMNDAWAHVTDNLSTLVTNWSSWKLYFWKRGYL